MDIRTPHIRTPYIGTPSIKARSVGASLVTGATKDVIATPVITLTDNSVTITCDTTGATIYYTLNGSTPTSGSTQYSAAFTLDSSCTIKAIAIKGGKSSGIAEEEYVKPIIYLTQWKLVGNSEVHGNEIWSCGEYNPIDGKWHILVQPLGGSIADIALTEPLRKVNNVADTIEFIDGVGTLTRNFASALLSDVNWYKSVISSGKYRYDTSGFKSLDKPIKPAADNAKVANVLCSIYNTISANKAYTGGQVGISVERTGGKVYLYDSNYDQEGDIDAFRAHIQGAELIYELETPTTETIQVPQIEEADSYSCVISQGAKAVSWSDFETE